MEKVILKAEIRTEVGKEALKKLRRQDLVPAVIYKAKGKATNLKLVKRDLFKALHTEAGENVIINLKLSGEADSPKKKTASTSKSAAEKSPSKTVIVKEIQYHPIKGNVLHIDFSQISLTEKLTVDVPVETKGESLGVKEGGVLEHILWELKVECLPTNIPEKIEVNVTDLKIGDTIHVKALSIPAEVKVLSDPEAIVVSVKPPTVEKVEEEVIEEEPTEPEVITERKEKEPEEAEEAPPPEEKKEKKK